MLSEISDKNKWVWYNSVEVEFRCKYSAIIVYSNQKEGYSYGKKTFL